MRRTIMRRLIGVGLAVLAALTVAVATGVSPDTYHDMGISPATYHDMGRPVR